MSDGSLSPLPPSPGAAIEPAGDRPPGPCWAEVGVWGDATCPTLVSAKHCRNCPVFSTRGRGLLERAAPVDYLKQWTDVLSQAKESNDAVVASVIIFRLGDELFALNARVFKEATESKQVHRVPHRTDNVFLGLVNVRGEVLLCFSLTRLLDLEANPESKGPAVKGLGEKRVFARLAVIGKERDIWAFPADEIQGLHSLPQPELRIPPVTSAKGSGVFAKGVFTLKEETITLLDDDLLFRQLERQFIS